MFQLHKHNYDTSKALQALVKCPAMKTIEKKWSEEDSVSCLKFWCTVTSHLFIVQMSSFGIQLSSRSTVRVSHTTRSDLISCYGSCCLILNFIVPLP